MQTRWWAHFGVILIASFLVDGTAVAACWNWFVVPATHVPGIDFRVAVGLRLFLAATMRPTLIPRPSEQEIQEKLDEGQSPTRIFIGIGAAHFGDRISILVFAVLWHAVAGG